MSPPLKEGLGEGLQNPLSYARQHFKAAPLHATVILSDATSLAGHVKG